LNGKDLTIHGNLIQEGGTLNVNEGRLVVEGDYRLQKQDGGYSTGILQMLNANDKVLVEGNFVMDSTYAHNNYLKAGVLEVKSNFFRRTSNNYGGRYNFSANTSHRVILSGNEKQTINFDYPHVDYSHFNILEIANSSEEGVIFSTAFNANTLLSNGHKLNSIMVDTMDWVLNENVTISDDLTLKNSLLNLNNNTLIIEGNLIHSGGTLFVNNGSLIIKGDYRLQKQDGGHSTGILQMLNANDKVFVEGDFVMDSTYAHNNYLKAGVLEVKSNFSCKLSNSSGGRYNFSANTSHRVILSGNEKQTVNFDYSHVDFSHFNILEIKNLSEEAINFETKVVVIKLFNHNQNYFTLNHPSEFPDYDNDTIKDNLDMYPLDPSKWAAGIITAFPTKASVNQPIQFICDPVVDISRFEWDFDNDGTPDSFFQNPVHFYTEPKVYSVKLIAYRGNTAFPHLKDQYIEVLGDDTPLTLAPIGDKNFTHGQSVNFTVQAYGGLESLTYSAKNLPQGAEFNPVTQRFIWNAAIEGIYENVIFEVTDGVSTKNETITVRVSKDDLNILLSGIVKNQNCNDPIIGANLILTGDNINLAGQTDNDGAFCFDNLLPGIYNLKISANGYASSIQSLVLFGKELFEEEYCLSQSIEGCETFGSLRICADSITKNGNNIDFSKNVNINHILYFDEDKKIIVENSDGLNTPILTGSCDFYVKADNGNVNLYNFTNSMNYTFLIDSDNNRLIAKNLGLAFEIPIKIGGVPLALDGITISGDAQTVKAHVIPKFPFPLDKIFEVNSLPSKIDECSIDLIINRETGLRDYEVNLTLPGYNFRYFHLEEVNIRYNTKEEEFKGSARIKIPGEWLNKASETTKTQRDNNHLDDIPLEIINEGKTIETTSLHTLTRKVGSNKSFSLLEFGVNIIFIKDEIDKFQIDVRKNIPLDATGLYITKMSGGISNLTKPEDFSFNAMVDIETGLELPAVGSPIALKSFGVEIAPMTRFKGTGQLEVFNADLLNASLEYNHQEKKIAIQGDITLADIIEGELFTSLKYKEFIGSANVAVKLPDNLPFFLKWASNFKLAETQADIYNYEIKFLAQIWKLSLAQKIEFNEDLPYVHYSLGTSYDNLTQLFRSMRNNRSNIKFNVHANCPQLVVVTSNDKNLFDISVTNASGTIYDKNHTHYRQFASTLQTVLIVDYPEAGQWTLNTEQEGEIQCEFLGLDQKPTIVMTSPKDPKSHSNRIAMTATDYNNSFKVQLFYDSDRKNFDGTLIKTFECLNNANIDYDWPNATIPNGEYFIYSRIDDGKNFPVRQYASGSIHVVNDAELETPQGLIVSQENDSVTIQWDKPVSDQIYATQVYWQNISTGKKDDISIIDENFITLNNFLPGQEYNIWARFMDSSGNLSLQNDPITFVFVNNESNNPPYFKMPVNTAWNFVVGQTKNINLLADDADDDLLTFRVSNTDLGLIINENTLSWTPQGTHSGSHQLQIIVDDGNDTAEINQKIVVIPLEQALKLSFSSWNLYEEDNMYVILNNSQSPKNTETVHVKNLNSGNEISVLCQRVNAHEFIGQFTLSVQKRSAIPVSDGDNILASYESNGTSLTAKAIYQSTPQSSDTIPPSDITDLSVSKIQDNHVFLKWTSPGDDASEGNAYYYDLRYSFSPIDSETEYQSATILSSLEPKPSGETDSFIVSLTDIDPAGQYNQIHFCIKAIDEMANKSNVSNCARADYLIEPYNLSSSINNDDTIMLSWSGPENRIVRNAVDFHFFEIYRKINDENFEIIADTITSNTYVGNLNLLPDGKYQYGVKAVYSTGTSDINLFDVVHLERLTPIKILVLLEDRNVAEGVQVKLTPVDSSSKIIYKRDTNLSGLILIDNVRYGHYTLELSKAEFETSRRQISISEDKHDFSFVFFKSFDGNINGDSTVDLMDAVLALHVLVGANPLEHDMANKITLNDVIFILQKVSYK
jgi:PKD repeat protein